MNGISYTFPANCPVAALAGKTVTGGMFGKRIHNGKAFDVVNFETLIDGKPVCAIVAGKPELEAAFAAHQAEKAAEARTRAEARRIYDLTLEGQREILCIAEYNTYSEDYFPGTRKWFINQDARKALEAFDAAHPEIVAAIDAARKAKDEADYEALSDFVKCGS